MGFESGVHIGALTGFIGAFCRGIVRGVMGYRTDLCIQTS